MVRQFPPTRTSVVNSHHQRNWLFRSVTHFVMPAISVRAALRLELDTTAIPADLIAIASICLLFTIASVCARMFTKFIDLKRMQIDDCMYCQSAWWHLLTFADIIAVAGVRC
jgi:hypothetical protein